MEITPDLAASPKASKAEPMRIAEDRYFTNRAVDSNPISQPIVPKCQKGTVMSLLLCNQLTLVLTLY